MENKYVYGVKGFDKNLQCRKFQYEVGHTYHFTDKVKICNKGFHFSPSYKFARNFYGSHSGNRFCLVRGKIPSIDEIEPGAYDKTWKHEDKYVTNELTVLKELTKEELDNIKREEGDAITDDEIFRIEELKTIQKTYPLFSVGGSVGLYLQGFNIKRDKKVNDFDFVIPYYQRMQISDFKKEDEVFELDQMDDAKNSGNDFDYTNGINIGGDFMLMDMCINPKAKNIFVEYDGFKFNVCPWEIIIDAKMRYLNSATGPKHKKDLLEMFGNPEPIKTKTKEKELSTYEKLLSEFDLIDNL